MNVLQIVEIGESNTLLLSEFLGTINESRKNFRYFENRDFECLQDHMVTLVFKLGDTPAAYGHLDKEDDKVWLGVCVSDEHHGIGLGKKMMECLFDYAKKFNLKKINLSVDKGNKVAYALYEKVGFVLENESEKSFFMKKEF